MRATWILCGALLLAGCSSDSGGGDGLADRDPKGAEACALLAEAFENRDDEQAAIQGVFDAGKAAAEASTDAISGTVNNVAGEALPDAQALRDACDAEGVDMPEVPSG